MIYSDGIVAKRVDQESGNKVGEPMVYGRVS